MHVLIAATGFFMSYFCCLGRQRPLKVPTPPGADARSGANLMTGTGM